MRVRFPNGAALAALLTLPLPSSPAHAQGGPYVNFESIPTRALALSPDGTRLFVTNTPDSRLEIFQVTEEGLQPAGSVPVGFDPVAVAPRSDKEVWVVNLLSDSVSVVDVSANPPRVTRTLFVGDEPRDIVFAGPNRDRAFITAARRGQNHPSDTVNETQKPGVPRADVWVFDAADPGSAVGGKPLTIVSLFSDKPGALTTSLDGKTVFVSVATSGNETSVVNASAVCGPNGQVFSLESRQENGPCDLQRGGSSPGGVLAPNQNQVDGAPNPRTGVIVKFDRATGAWNDSAGRDFRAAIPFTLPDNDVFAIDATANPPAQTRAFQHVGTLNASLVVHPTSGKLYVATIEAMNLNRFLSLPAMNLFPNPNPAPGVARTADPASGKTLNGHLYESRVSILSPDGDVVTRHLNKHIDYEVVPSPPGVKERSVADPRGVLFSPDGSTLFVAAFGSNAIVPFRTAELDDDSFTPDASTHIRLTGDGGPTDMVFDQGATRMFVYKRFDNAVAVVDLAAKQEVASLPMFSPEPSEVRTGRKFFYDARTGSSNGEANCSVCHPSADKDDLAWDLATPFASVKENTNPVFGGAANLVFNPLKGPMTVLTLRGIKDSGPLFWRGDQTVGDSRDERANFQLIDVVFPALLGRDGKLPEADFARLTDWVMTLIPPPNPFVPLDNQLTESQASGRSIFTGGEGPNDGVFACSDCHVVDPAMGFFGTGGFNTAEGESQEFKVVQLRTTYDKIGMFGQTFGLVGDPRTLDGPRTMTGPQVRGTGTLHDGSAAGAEEFLTSDVFTLDERQLRQVTDFVYAFPSNVAPVVGQQATLRADSGPDTLARIDLFQQRAAAPFVLPGDLTMTECELVARAVVAGEPRGFLFQPTTGDFLDSAGNTVTSTDVRALAQTPGQEVTFTCAYPGAGRRLALDRDLDGSLDTSPAR
jgi:YVTN family beta-propeller protein